MAFTSEESRKKITDALNSDDVISALLPARANSFRLDVRKSLQAGRSKRFGSSFNLSRPQIPEQFTGAGNRAGSGAPLIGGVRADGLGTDVTPNRNPLLSPGLSGGSGTPGIGGDRVGSGAVTDPFNAFNVPVQDSRLGVGLQTSTPEELRAITKLIGKAAVGALIGGPAGVAQVAAKEALKKRVQEKMKQSKGGFWKNLFDKLFPEEDETPKPKKKT